jgi:glycosyltransferase involved in cell wall biosynthesis
MELKDKILPFFSVIIPTYNRSEELFNCLSKLVNQTFKDFEVIICDDGSNDGTKETVNYFILSLDIKYLFNQNSGGPAKPRNNGIDHAQGYWIAFLDSDDLWYDDKLEKVFNVINNFKHLDFISHDLIINNNSNKNRVLSCGPIESNRFYHKLLLFGNRFPNSSVVVKKSFILNNNIRYNESSKFSSVEDYDFILMITKFKANMYALNLALGEYTIHNQNISNNEKHLKNLKYLLIFHAYHIQDIDLNKKRFALTLFCRYFIIKSSFYYKNKKMILSYKYLISAFLFSPKTFLGYTFKRIFVMYNNFKFNLKLFFLNINKNEFINE